MAKLNLTTPIGTARYPKITSPDTEGQYADGKYKTDLVLSDGDLKDVTKTIKEFAKAEFPDVKDPKLPIIVQKDKESGEVTTSIRFKSARKPLILDAKKNRVPDGVTIGGGSRLRLGGTLASYNAGGNKGITIYLNAVQVVELAQGFSEGDFDEYDGEDAYVAEVPDVDALNAASEFEL
jgi:hypothetical protein